MARKFRLEYPGACYHVINRGNYRRNVFAPQGAAEAFERCLGETGARFGWRVHAFVIMRNHFHLAVETPDPNLSLGMKFLQGTWANRFNRYHGETGRPFQGRYKALHVEPGEALAQVAHYIHLNPLRAKVVPGDRLGEFRWSSLWWFPRTECPAYLEPATVLREAGGLELLPGVFGAAGGGGSEGAGAAVWIVEPGVGGGNKGVSAGTDRGFAAARGGFEASGATG